MTAMNFKMMNSLRFNSVYNWSVHYNKSDSVIFSQKYKKIKISDVLKRSKVIVDIEDDIVYKRVTIKLYGKGVKIRDEEIGSEIKTKRQFLLQEGQFIYSRIDARNGAFGLAGKDVHNAIITNDFPTFDIDKEKILPQYLSIITGSKSFFDFCQNLSSGTTGRQRMDENSFLSFEIPLPNLEEQNQLVNQYNKNLAKAQKAENQANELEKSIESYLLEELGIDAPKPVERKQGLQFIRLKEMNSWSIDKILYDGENDFNQFQRLSNKINVENAFRGKSPKYEEDGEATILNQKCNRWNEIKLEFAKSVNKNWFDSIDDKFKTVENDILINSTGDGTIGRSSLVTKGFEGLIYDSHVLLVRLNQNLIHPSFFVYQFNSAFIQSQIEQIKSAQSTKQTELGLDNLFKLNFKFPSLEIQTQIVNHITTQKEQIKNLRQQAEKLRKQAKENFEKEIFVTT